MRFPIAALFALAAAACGSGASHRNDAAGAAPASNEVLPAEVAGAEVAALNETQRNATFYRAIHDAGMDCQQVTASQPGGSYRGMPVWNATCRGGGHWTLVIGSNDVVQVLNANEARLVTDQGASAGNSTARR
jgi:hypothetical protein